MYNAEVVPVRFLEGMAYIWWGLISISRFCIRLMEGTGSGGRFVMITLNTTHFYRDAESASFLQRFLSSYPFGLCAVLYPGSAQTFGDAITFSRRGPCVVFTNVVYFMTSPILTQPTLVQLYFYLA